MSDSDLVVPAPPYPPHPPVWRIEAALAVLRGLPDIHGPAWWATCGVINWRTSGRVDRWVAVSVYWDRRYTEADGWPVMGWIKHRDSPTGRNWRAVISALNRGIT